MAEKTFRPMLTYADEAHKLPETAQQMYGRRLEREDAAEICTLLEQEKYTHTAAKLREGFHQLFSAVIQETDATDRNQCRTKKSDQERFSFLPGELPKEALKHCIRLLKKAEDTTEGKIPRWLSNRLGETRELLRLFFSVDRNLQEKETLYSVLPIEK